MMVYGKQAIDEAVKAKKNKFIDYTGLFFIAILSLGYVLFYSYFAKLHIDLYLIKAPLFIGEMVFVICFFLFFVKWLINQKNVNIFTYLFLLYFGFVIVKTLQGYIYWGPLSLRHSVLFLYPLFAVFSKSFYRNDFFNNNKNLFLIFVFFTLFLIARFFIFYEYSGLTCIVLTLLLINAYPQRRIKYILYPLSLLLFPYKILFATSRTFIVSNLAAIIYMGLVFLIILKIKSLYRLIFCLLILYFVFNGLVKFSDPNELRSLVGIKRLINKYNGQMKAMRMQDSTYVEVKSNVKLFNDKSTRFQDLVKNRFVKRDQLNENAGIGKEYTMALVKKDTKVAKMVSKKTDEVADLDMEADVPYSNSVFRIFIWADAFKELRIKHPIFGFDFGKPFRSHSLEILAWGEGEWSRDGWVCLHNSYIDIIYRAGIVGILMIVFLLIIVFFLIRKSLKSRSLTGCLLTGVLINWFIAANFLEILEMPYSAIPLWSLFGLTSAYLFKNKSL